MLLDGKQRLTRKQAYDLAMEAVGTSKRTRITQLKVALAKLSRPLRVGNMAPVPEGELTNLKRDALVLVRFVRNKSKHWMVWAHRRELLLDPERAKSQFSEFDLVSQIEVAE